VPCNTDENSEVALHKTAADVFCEKHHMSRDATHAVCTDVSVE
jgi:hypothetical protein